MTWKDDPELDDGDRKKDKSRPKPSLAEERLGQVSPAVLVRWVDVDSDDWPYRTPEEEFISSPFPLDLQVLCARWEGLWTRAQIEEEYGKNNWKRRRFDWQREVYHRAQAESLAKDVTFQAEVIERDIVSFSHLLDMILADIEAGVEYRTVRGGGEFGYVKMPLTADSKNKLANVAVVVSNLIATRVGLATEIAETRGGDGPNSLLSGMREMLAQTDPEFAALLQVAGLNGRVFVSNAHQLEDGVPILDVTGAPPPLAMEEPR